MSLEGGKLEHISKLVNFKRNKAWLEISNAES